MAHITVEEILVLARYGVLKQTSKNRALIEALGQDILGRWMTTIYTRPFSFMSATGSVRNRESQKWKSLLHFGKPRAAEPHIPAEAGFIGTYDDLIERVDRGWRDRFVTRPSGNPARRLH